MRAEALKDAASENDEVLCKVLYGVACIIAR